MDEHKDAAQHEQQAPTEVPPPVPPPVDPPRPPPNPAPERDDDTQKISKSDKIMIWATCVIAAGTLVSSGAIVMQWREMVGGGTQTDQIIGAANGIKTAQAQLVLDNKQVLEDNRLALDKSLSENRVELGNVLKQNREALQAQTGASNGQLAAIQQQTELSERAWVGLSPLLVVPTTTPNNPVKDARGSVVNTGKTPATKVSAIIGMYSHSGIYVPNKKDEDWIKRVLKLSRSHIFGDKMRFTWSGYAGKFDYFDPTLRPPGANDNGMEEVPQSFALGALPPNAPYSWPLPLPEKWAAIGVTAIVYGEIDYSDFTGKPRHTMFCFYSYASAYPAKFSACSVFNEMD